MNLAPLYSQHISTMQQQFSLYLSQQGYGGLLLASGQAQGIFRDDYHYPFVVSSYFKEWLPLDTVPHCYLLLELDCRPRLFFYKPVDIWHKVEPLPSEFWCSEFDIIAYSDIATVKQALAAIDCQLAYIGPEQDAQDLGCERLAINPAPLLAWVDYQRAYKSPYEIACISEANRIAATAHRAAQQAFIEGCSEYAINQSYLNAVQAREQDLPYGNIVALNQHGAILHYTFLERQAPEPSRSFLIDAGYRFNGYAADISRSYCRDSSAAGILFQQLIDDLDTAQQQLITNIKVGDSYLAMHQTMHCLVGDILHKAGVILVTGEQALAAGITAAFLPHGLGHLLGLQVHDQGGWFSDASGKENPPPAEHPYLRLTRDIEEGMVFTIEPGIYFIPALLEPLKKSAQAAMLDWDKVEALSAFGGIRIEDNIAIVDGRAKNLTREYL